MTGQRQPEATAPQRIAPLATLPLFHKLRGRTVILVGGSDGALWKAELLAAAGGHVLCFTEAPSEALEALQMMLAARRDEGMGRIEIITRPFVRADLEGAALAIGDFADQEQARAFADLVHQTGVPLNIIDNPAFCDVQFGAIVNRSPLIVSISTDGAAPVFGQAIRAKIEALLPRGLTAWAQAARDWRPLVQARRLAFASRRAFWEKFTARALAAPDRLPTDEDRDALIASLETPSVSSPAGQVILVGAGPGDPDLLTLKAVRAMQAADVLLFDDLVSPEVLELARREAERIRVGKTGHGPSCKQSDISRLIVELAQQGKRVVRLKSGDPMVFGRATEEIDACHAAGIAVSIVPGITAAQGAAASIGISLTERKKARRLQFLTGHGEDGTLPVDVNWSAIADKSVTTIVYMPRRTLGELRDRALAAGLDPQTPAVAILSATRADEQRVFAPISAFPEMLSTFPEGGPVLIMIGQVLRRYMA